MNKSGLLGILAIAAVIILIIIFGLLYFQIKNEGLQITTGNFVIDIKYDDGSVDYLEDGGTDPNEIIYNETSQNISTDDNKTGGENEG